MIAAMLKIFMGMQTDIEPETVDFGPYDTLVIAAPIWAAQFGLAMRTFVERNDFEGKPVIIFITADSFVDEKYQRSTRRLSKLPAVRWLGIFRCRQQILWTMKKCRGQKKKIVEDTLKLAPAI